MSVGSGGVRVQSGGLSVGSGGVTVEGGIKVASGSLDIATPEGLAVSQGGVLVQSLTEARPALVAKAPSPLFRGAVARLEADPHASTSSSSSSLAGANGVSSEEGGGSGAVFNFLEATVEGDPIPRMAIDGDGKVFAAELHSASGVVAKGGLAVGGRVALTAPGTRPAIVSAGAGITIDPCSALTPSSYVRIASDGAASLNRLRLPVGLASAGGSSGSGYTSSSSSGGGGGQCSPNEGQLLMVYNGDEEPTTGDAEVPPGKAVLFVFSLQAGPGWVPLTTLDARSTKLEGVTSLTAANNLDLGSFALKAQQLVAAGQTKGQLSLYGAGGLLQGDPTLTFDAQEGTLSTPKINVKQVDSSGVDFMGSPLTNVRIESGSASGLSVVRTGQLFVESLGVSSGQLLVAGSGSGISSASEVYVSDQATAANPTSSDLGVPKQASTLTTPALRVTGLAPFSGSLGLVGVHGEVLARSDIGISVLADRANTGTFSGEAVSMAEAADLGRRGKPTQAVLRAPRIATAVLVGATPVTTVVPGEAGEADAEMHSMKAEVKVEGDLVLGGNLLRGATIVESSLTGLDELGVTWLTVRAAKGSSLAYFSENSTLQSLPGAVVGPGGALSFDTVGIRKLSEDLDVGGHTLTNLKVTGGNLDGLKSIGTESLVLTEAAPAVAAAAAVMGAVGPRKLFSLLGPGGKVEASPAGLSFDAEQRVLHASTLGPHAWAGNVDGKGFSLSGATVTGGSVTGVQEVASEGGLSCKGDLDVGEDGSVGGTLVVGGTVMGSGPYVDSSDARLKTSVVDLFPSQPPSSPPLNKKTLETEEASDHDDSDNANNQQEEEQEKQKPRVAATGALDLIRALRPVRYRFNQTIGEANGKRLPTGDEIGFIAQEVEEVLPEIVTDGKDGFK